MPICSNFPQNVQLNHCCEVDVPALCTNTLLWKNDHQTSNMQPFHHPGTLIPFCVLFWLAAYISCTKQRFCLQLGSLWNIFYIPHACHMTVLYNHSLGTAYTIRAVLGWTALPTAILTHMSPKSLKKKINHSTSEFTESVTGWFRWSESEWKHSDDLPDQELSDQLHVITAAVSHNSSNYRNECTSLSFAG